MEKALDPSQKQRPRGRPFTNGNPGRPRGSRNKVTVALEQLLEGRAEALVEKVVEKALEGDRMAMRLVFERLMGSRHERLLPDLDLPPIHSAADAAAVAADILAAASSGKITPGEGVALMQMVDIAVGAFEASIVEQTVSDLEQRLRAVESAPGKKTDQAAGGVMTRQTNKPSTRMSSSSIFQGRVARKSQEQGSSARKRCVIPAYLRYARSTPHNCQIMTDVSACSSCFIQ
jgi:hypothetical protein